MSKSKILVVGGTGYIGKRVVKASLGQGHPTFVLMRREIGYEIEKLQTLLSYKEQGAQLVDEFGIDPSRMEQGLEYGKETFADKMVVRKAIEDANIPYTYISANCLGGYFVGNLSQPNTLVPPKERVSIYGDGNRKVVFMDEDDVATYTIKTVDDPRTLNKTLYLRPHESILTHNDLVEKWEKLTNKTLQKVHISAEEFLASMKDLNHAHQAAFARIYQIFYDGCLNELRNWRMGRRSF